MLIKTQKDSIKKRPTPFTLQVVLLDQSSHSSDTYNSL